MGTKIKTFQMKPCGGKKPIGGAKKPSQGNGPILDRFNGPILDLINRSIH